MEKDQKIMVGWRISRIRDKHNKTLEEFGKLIDGATKSNVSKWEKGEVLPNRKRLKMIADYDGIHVNELLYGGLDSFASSVLIKTIEEFVNQNTEKDSGISIIKLLNIPEIDKSFRKWFEDNVKTLSYDDEKLFREMAKEVILENIDRHRKENPFSSIDAILETSNKLLDAQLDLKDYFYYAEEDANGDVKLVLREGMSEALYDALDSILSNSQHQISFLLTVYDLDEEEEK